MDAENETCNNTIRIIIKSQMVRLLLNALQSVYVDACSIFCLVRTQTVDVSCIEKGKKMENERERDRITKNDSNKAIDV